MVKFIGEINYQHGSIDNTGILLTNLGTPDAPNAKSLKIYLNEFLSDQRVIELPKFFWKIILHGIILQTRPRRSAKAYKSIWTEKGSPLLNIATKKLEHVKKKLSSDFPNTVFALGMRYGNPSIKNALEVLQKNQARKLLILPLYPQYCAATTGSTFDSVSEILQTWRWIPEIRFINQYFEEKKYIEALSYSISSFWKKNKFFSSN